jgi:predicted dithiol-disulfide oxidoreductase (DUF899 family)
MGRFHERRFPGEDDAYRTARDELLAAEMDLRQRLEDVATMRRELPPGGALPEEYVFVEETADGETETRFSDLFAPGKDSLIVYSFMYGPDAEAACPMCTSLLDTWDGAMPHLGDRINIAVVAKSPIARIREWAAVRGWNRLRLLSSAENSYNSDYGAESPDGGQLPAINVFRRIDSGIHHTYNAELFYADNEAGQHPRHADILWPLWSVFDLTPDGRGSDWFPKLNYD